MDVLGMGPSKGVTLKYEAHPQINTEDCLYHCPECKSTFFGGGRAMHQLASCEENGYKGCQMLITPAFVEAVKRRAAMFGDDFGYWGVSLNALRHYLPEIWVGHCSCKCAECKKQNHCQGELCLCEEIPE